MEAGDTQVLPSQEMTSYLAQNLRLSTAWLATGHAISNGSGTNETSARTYHTGETGHVDLIQNSTTQEPVVGSIEVEESSEDELVRSLQEPEHPITSSTPLSPKTPGLTGYKRDHYGNVKSPTVRTPAPDLQALFGAGSRTGAMGLSQLFKQTQADSSPFLGAPRSDAIFERPSPDMVNLRQSSRQYDTSSPVLVRPASHPAITDPRKAYISMKESQERRTQAALSSMSPALASDDDDELGENSEELRFARRKSTERLKQEAMKEFANYGAPLHKHRSDKKRRSYALGVHDTQQRHKKYFRNGEVIVISDDIRQEERNAVANSSDEESIDQYDEYSQTIIHSDRQGHEREVTPVEVPTTITRSQNSQQHQRAISSPLLHGNKRDSKISLRRSFPGTVGSPFNRTSPNAFDGSKSATQSQIFAVADSQPENSFRQPYLVPPPRPVPPSSFDSRAFLSQSQGYSLSSNARMELATFSDDPEPSSIPFPPALPENFQEVEDEMCQGGEAPGSSPPVVDLKLDPNSDFPQQACEGVSAMKKYDIIPVVSEMVHDRQVLLYAPLAEQRNTSISVNDVVQSVPSQTIPETSPPITPNTREIPDSDPARGQSLAAKSTCRQNNEVTKTSEPVHVQEYNEVEHFDTAQTHQSIAASATINQPQPPIPRLSDLVAGFTPPGSHQNNVGEITIMNDEDLNFQAVISKSPSSSPPRKRVRRTYGRKASLGPGKKGNIQPQSSSLKTGSDERTDSQTTPPLVPGLEGDFAVAAASARLQGIVNEDTPRSPGQLSRPAPGRHDRPCAKSLNVLEVQPLSKVSSEVISGNNSSESFESIDKETADAGEESKIVRSSEIETPGGLLEDENVGAAISATTPSVATVDPMVPNRVLAKFRGLKVACYPATCLGVAISKALSYKVRFDDGTIDEVNINFVRRFELQPGDVVKVDLPTLRTKSWVVQGFKNKISSTSSNENPFPLTDIHGHLVVVVHAYHRQSLPGSGEDPDSETIEVPMTSIYIPLAMFNRFKDRAYQHLNATSCKPRLETPTIGPSLPVTPSSRSRRHTATIGAQSGVEIANNTTNKGGIFHNMAFAITYSSGKDVERNRITQLIKDNGGRILTEGFHELFDIPMPTFTSPSKTSRLPGSDSQPALTLSPNATNLGFTALIADSHSRRAKYMQALALNLPCLCGRWISDCLMAEKTIAWERYLLPAGESTFLDGAVRSRTFASQDVFHENYVNTKLCTTIERRAKLLEDKSVILVMGEGKVDERRRAYLFLTYALGVKYVERVKSIKSAKSLFERDDHRWDWVYVDDAKLKEAAAQLNGLVDVIESRTKKRKRTSTESVSIRTGLRKPKLVGDEYVMQSLILGALLEEV